MRKMNAFYAWQSDTSQEFNRHLIEIALQELLVRGRMDEPHVSGFVTKEGFGHLTGTWNGLRFDLASSTG